ncbi:MAG: hypothetical protein WC783_00590 [Candidatus Paceibacterota bacterium]|jgi:hypothetical protein
MKRAVHKDNIFEYIQWTGTNLKSIKKFLGRDDIEKEKDDLIFTSNEYENGERSINTTINKGNFILKSMYGEIRVYSERNFKNTLICI